MNNRDKILKSVNSVKSANSEHSAILVYSASLSYFISSISGGGIRPLFLIPPVYRSSDIPVGNNMLFYTVGWVSFNSIISNIFPPSQAPAWEGIKAIISNILFLIYRKFYNPNESNASILACRVLLFHLCALSEVSGEKTNIYFTNQFNQRSLSWLY